MRVMAAGVLNTACVAVALTGRDLRRFVVALFLLGVGWNFLFDQQHHAGDAESLAARGKDAHRR